MTIRVAASFDLGGNSDADMVAMWANLGCSSFGNGNGFTQTSAPGNAFDNGGGYLWPSNSNGDWKIVLPDNFSGDTFWMGVWVYVRSGAGVKAGSLFGIHRGPTTATSVTPSTVYSVFTIVWTGTDNIYQLNDATGAAIGGTFTLAEDTWVYVAIEVDSNSTGTLTLKIDGTVHLNAVAGDYLGTAGVDTVYAWLMDYSYNGAYYDDFVCGDGAGSINTGLPDKIRIDPLLPTSDDSLTGFTNPTWSAIDEVGMSDEDTSYTEAGTTSDEFTCAVEDLPFTPGDIYGVQLVARGRRTGTKTRAVRPRLKVGGTYYNGDDYWLNFYSHLIGYSHLWEVDPDTASAWTESGVNATLIGGIVI